MMTPRRDSASTSNVLTGTDVAAGVTVALASRVTVELVAVSTGGAQADRRKIKEKSSGKILLAKQHHRDGRENENEENDCERADRASPRIEFGDLVERLGMDASQPEEEECPQPPGLRD